MPVTIATAGDWKVGVTLEKEVPNRERKRATA
jgi:hypothetical protein